VDIALTVVICFVQLVLGAMGVYVSLRPPKPEQHRLWIGSFILVGLAGIALTGYLAKRGSDTQEQLTSLIKSQKQEVAEGFQNTQHTIVDEASKTRTELSQPHSTSKKVSGDRTGFLQERRIEVIPSQATIALGRPFVFRMGYINRGAYPVYNAKEYAEVSLVQNVTDGQTANAIVYRALENAMHDPKYGGHPIGQLGVDSGVHNDVGWEFTSQDQVNGVISGQHRLYVFSWATWTDKEGHGQKPVMYCSWMAAPSSGQITQETLEWHYCQH
jgi:hypothetical protein